MLSTSTDSSTRPSPPSAFAPAIVDHLLAVAAARGSLRVSLETGSMEAFAPARSLYARAGFVPTGPFGDYGESPNSTFMTLLLGDGAPEPQR